MDYNVRFNLAATAVWVSLASVIGVLTSTMVVSRAYVKRGEQAVQADQLITVKGSARKRIRSDQAVWYISVRGEDKDLKPAFTTLDAGVEKVRSFLATQGFKESDLALSAINTTEHHVRDAKGNETREISGYSLTRGFTVTSANVDRIAKATGEVTQLIQDGILVFSAAPAYYYGDLAKLKVEMMADAAKDARSRADNIANETGCRVKEVRSAQMGVLQVTQPFSTEVSDWGTYDTSTIEKDVQSVVTVKFRIEAG